MPFNHNKANDAPRLNPEVAPVLQPRYTVVYKGVTNVLQAAPAMDRWGIAEANAELASQQTTSDSVKRVAAAVPVQSAETLAGLAMDAQVQADNVFAQTEPNLLQQGVAPLDDRFIDEVQQSQLAGGAEAN